MEVLNVDIRTQIISGEIERQEVVLYSLRLKARAAKAVENVQLEGQLLRAVEDQLRVIDFLKEELKRVENEKE